MGSIETIAITGGAGYVGSALVPALLERGYRVKVIDLFLYGREQVFGKFAELPNLVLVDGDIRNGELMKSELADVDALIHLACISNDPSFELNPGLGKTINYDAFFNLLSGLENGRTRRFIYASSSSVYGVREEAEVTEDTPKTPLTDYSKFKLLCEEKLREWDKPEGLDWTIIRPATVCGYAPRLRLDLTVNILTIHALLNKKIRVFGGKQLRPNIYIVDMVRAYLALLDADREKVSGAIFNAGYQNDSVENIAFRVRDVLADPDLEIEYVPNDDDRSYHVNSDRIEREIGFRAEHTIEDAIDSIKRAFDRGDIEDGLNNEFYYNIKRMQNIHLV
jgi:nucleoside-diphosphate-sugar epimerase